VILGILLLIIIKSPICRLLCEVGIGFDHHHHQPLQPPPCRQEKSLPQQKRKEKGKRNYYIFSLIAYGIMNVMIKSLQALSVKFISYPLTLNNGDGRMCFWKRKSRWNALLLGPQSV
jgi:hypothetical protein